MGVIPVNSLRTTPTVPKPTFSITITTWRRERTPAFFAPAVRITKVCIKRTNKSARGYGTTKMAPLNQQEITRNLDQRPNPKGSFERSRLGCGGGRWALSRGASKLLVVERAR